MKNCYLNSLSNDVNGHYKKLLDEIKTTYNTFGYIKRYTMYKKRSIIPKIMFTNEKKTAKITNDSDIVNAIANNFEKNHLL